MSKMTTTATTMNRCFRLRNRPAGVIKSTDLELCQEPLPTIQDGQCLVENMYISIDPTHRIWMSDRPQYMDPVNVNDVMRAVTLGKVVESKVPNNEYPVGSYVTGMGGVQDYFVGIPNATIMGKAQDASTTNLSVCSFVIGLTAWHGINKVLNVGSDDVVCVSGAAGAVGSLAAQLSKLKGAKVVGIAGGPTKCNYLTQELGLDGAVDYKKDNIDEALQKFAPNNGITCYFDNVGGPVTEAVMSNMSNFSRFAYCGSISEYNDKFAGITNFNMILMRRMTVKGYICTDHADEYPECVQELSALVADGKIKYSEHIEDGLENYVDVVNMLYSGKNTGKLILKP